MRCPQFKSLNPDTALYCAQCGAALNDHDIVPLEIEAADVWHERVVAQEAVRLLRRYIAPAVVEGILHDQKRLRGERREVTILFADARISTQIKS